MSAETPTGSALRATPRFEVELPVEVTVGETTGTGLIGDLSVGGALIKIALDAPVAVGTRLDVSFALPDLPGAVSAGAEVRWVSQADQEVGVQFVTGFRAKEVWALGRYLERLSSSQP